MFIWKYRTAVLVLIMGLGLSGLWLYSKGQAARIDELKARLSYQEQATAACEKERKISYEASEKYQTRLSDLDRQLNSLRVQYRTVCIPVDAPGRPDATAAEGKLSGPHGVNAEALLEFAAACEKERLKVIGLQDFITKANDAR